MLHRFLTLSQSPELRAEPSSPEAGVTDIEILIPVEVFWQMEDILKEIKFLKSAGFSTTRLNNKLIGLMRPYIVNERDRIAMSRNGSQAA